MEIIGYTVIIIVILATALVISIRISDRKSKQSH